MAHKNNMPPSSKSITPKPIRSNKSKENNNIAVSSFIMPSESETGNESLLPDKAEWDASAIEPSSNDCKPKGTEKRKPAGKNLKKIYMSNVIGSDFNGVWTPLITFLIKV